MPLLYIHKKYLNEYQQFSKIRYQTAFKDPNLYVTIVSQT